MGWKIGTMATILALVLGGSCFASRAEQKEKSHQHYVIIKTGVYKDHVFYLPSKKWPQRQVQVRVSQHRKLPYPISDATHGAYIHTTDFFPESSSSGNLVPSRYTERDGYKIWQFTNLVDADDLKGLRSFGICVDFFDGSKKYCGPLEIFHYPPIKDEEPEKWSDWTKASQCHGDMARRPEVHKLKPKEHKSEEHPFEIRWRFVLKDDPVRITDDGIVDDEGDGPTTLRSD